MENYYAVIMAGGQGTRLWPLSRRHNPKQSLTLFGSRTMFQIAVNRLAPLFPPERILVVAGTEGITSLRSQVPEIPPHNFVAEPHPRGTAAALGLAATEVLRRSPEGIMACLTADHYIGNEARFRELLATAATIAAQNYLVTLGITPTCPATSFGYIKRGELLGRYGEFEVFHATQFKEKPHREQAQAMLADGQHSWNAGMFVWRATRLMDEFARQLPELHRLLQETIGSPSLLAQRWPEAPRTTIDYGIMEHAAAVVVIPADNLGWHDIGSWETVRQVLPTDAEGNTVVGEHVGLDTHDSIIHAGNSGRHRLIATIGLNDMVIVDTDDVLLVCPRSRSQEVRHLVDKLTELGKEDYL